MRFSPLPLRPFLSLVFAGALAACSVESAPQNDASASASEEARTTYGDFWDTLEPADIDTWGDVRRSLITRFDDICGDTICGGDFSNLRTVKLACASTHATKKVTGCMWVLAGNISYVSGATGAITSEARVFKCPIVTSARSGTNAKAFLGALSVSRDPLNEVVPGTTKSFYENLTDCFAGVGATPPPSSTGTTFVSLEDRAWRTAERKLARAFDDVCGDTFCEGDYANIEPLGISCAFSTVTSHVSTCQWSFALAETNVTSRGKISVQSETRSCPIAVNASVVDLLDALNVAESIHASLPGGGRSFYDSLIDCL